jgi:hypothetical protein
MENTTLSPQAQAVLAATDYPEDWATRIRVAAAIRRVVDQAHPKDNIKYICYIHQNYVDGWQAALDFILAIADELEGSNG